MQNQVMSSIVNRIEINGPLADVFDLVTTTCYWPQWHPATIGVGGVTERPFRLGDQIQERAQIGDHTYEGIWTVVEYQHPVQATLRMQSGRIQIRYTFYAAGAATVYQRELTFYPEDFRASVTDPTRLEKLMHAQSEQALHKLKALVEQLVSANLFPRRG